MPRRTSGPSARRRAVSYLTTPEVPGWQHLEFGDGVTIDVADPHWTFEDRRRAARENAAEARAATVEGTQRLIQVLEATDSLGVYLQFVAQEQLERSRRPPEMHGYEGAIEFLGGLVTSLPPELVLANRSVPITSEVAHEVGALLRHVASLAPIVTAVDLMDDTDERYVEERYQLMLEKMYDRMSGYPQHLRAVNHAIFSGLDRACDEQLGFRPTRALDLAERHTRAIEEIRFRELDRLRSIDGAFLPASRSSLVSVFTMAGSQDPAVALSKASGWSSDEVSLLLKAMATPVGSQKVTSVLCPNRLRQFPVIELPNDGHVWPHPEDFMHEALDWFDALLLERGADKLRDQFSKSRANATEQLAVERLTAVFGKERVARGAVYRIGDNASAETDVVVDLPGAAIVVEAKAHRVTARGRAADPGRVRTKFRELVETPLAQSARARAALLAGAEFKAPAGHGRIRTTPRTEVARVVISLDRVDPFAAVAKDGEPDGPGDAWMVSLTDFLAVIDLLEDPTAIYAYIQTRMAQTAARSPHITMESDALGAWLRTREGVWPHLGGTAGQLAYTSNEVNAFFTRQEQHDRHPDRVPAPDRPTLAVPRPVLDLMRSELNHHNLLWPAAAKAIFSAHPKVWRPIHRDLARTTTTAPTGDQRRAMRRAAAGRALTATLHVAIANSEAVEPLEAAESGGVRIRVHPPEIKAR